MDTILGYVLQFALVFPAIVLHEISHGYVAYLLGDDTAKRAGRLSLNPLRHVDPVGTVILPISMLILSGGSYFFGWAKPVPINPHGFRRLRKGAQPLAGPYPSSMPQGFGAPEQTSSPMLPTGDARWAQRLGMMLTGAAGPATNIVLAIISGLGVRFLLPMMTGAGSLDLLAEALYLFARANLVLAFFNLVPIPPLDGSRILQFFLPDAARNAYHRFEQYGFMVLIGMTWLIPGLFSGYLSFTVAPLLRLLVGVG